MTDERILKLVEKVTSEVSSNPSLFAVFLKALIDQHETFVEHIKVRQDDLADEAIGDLIGVIMRWDSFNRLSQEERKRWMRSVLQYHFPHGTKGMSKSEVEFYEEYGL